MNNDIKFLQKEIKVMKKQSQLYQIENNVINLKYVVSVYLGTTGFIIYLVNDHQYNYGNSHYDKFLEAWNNYLNWSDKQWNY